MDTPLLDWQHIYDWAVSKEPGEVLGESCTNIHCPLANYLNEQTGKRWWSVGPSIRREGSDEWLVKPDWVEAMLHLVDTATGIGRGPVTREQFLAILDQVKP